MNQADAMCLRKRAAQLSEQEDGPLGRKSAVPADYFVEAQTREVFHRVEHGAVAGLTVIKNLDGIGMRQRRRHLHLSQESCERAGMAVLIQHRELIAHAFDA